MKTLYLIYVCRHVHIAHTLTHIYTYSYIHTDTHLSSSAYACGMHHLRVYGTVHRTFLNVFIGARTYITIAEQAEENAVRLKTQHPYHFQAGGMARGIRAALLALALSICLQDGQTQGHVAISTSARPIRSRCEPPTSEVRAPSGSVGFTGPRP